jgi:hypothetical protein
MQAAVGRVASPRWPRSARLIFGEHLGRRSPDPPTNVGRSNRGVRPLERVSAAVGLCFPETGFCWAETAASKRPVTFNRSSTETKSPHEKPPIRRYSHGVGKSLFVWDSVVADAVAVEPVSASYFPANREINREFCQFCPCSQPTLPDSRNDFAGLE